MSNALFEMPIAWKHTGDAELPYAAEVQGKRYTIRINDFPAEPLYTLLSEGAELEDLEDWPPAWQMPGPPKELLDALVAKVGPRCSGALRLVATSKSGDAAVTLALDGEEIVVDGARRLDIESLRERRSKVHAPPGRAAPALDDAAEERLLAFAPEPGVAVSTFVGEGGHAVRVHELRYARSAVLAVGQRAMRGAAIAPAGGSVIVLDEEGRALRYDVAGRGYPASAKVRRPPGAQPAFLGIARGGRVWIAASGASVEVRKMSDEPPLGAVDLSSLGEAVTSVLWLPEGRSFLVGTSRGVVRRYEVLLDRVGASREARVAAIADAVDAALADTRWERFAPRVEVYDERTSETGRSTLYFVADHHEYHQAQSGSDWETHDLCAGHATFDGDVCVEADVAEVDRRRLTESEAEGYDAAAALAAFRAQTARSRSSATVIPGGDAVKRAFDEHFASYRMAFPEACLHREAGTFSDGGWSVRYRFGRARGGACVDVHASHRMTNDRLYAVHEDGLVELVASSSEGVLEESDRAFDEEVRRRFG